jgi:hypothetical protein
MSACNSFENNYFILKQRKSKKKDEPLLLADEVGYERAMRTIELFPFFQDDELFL